MGAPKSRLDELLVSRGLFTDSESAKRAILAGDVRLGDDVARSVGQKVPLDAHIAVASRPRFVSRGGEKLEGALQAFAYDVTGKKCIDCGASTGGFTDCLLQHAASSVVAVDVGYGQFAWSLRQDPRVTLYERTNIRTVDPLEIGAPFDLAVADVSFAPLRSYLPSILKFLGESGTFITLIKPQFEVPKSMIGAHGVVRDKSAHIAVLEEAIELFEQASLAPRGLCVSPLVGPMGNIEFFLMGTRGQESLILDVEAIVESAHVLHSLHGIRGEEPK
ncbi:MAG: TlyA family RNA methyltransferase [Actinobacteria bacterium]|nr:TlyA family RNA methyltransferase [Actinomycetota bacterium]